MTGRSRNPMRCALSPNIHHWEFSSLAAVLETQAIDVEVVDLNRLYYEYLRSDEFGQATADFSAYTGRHFEASSFLTSYGFSSICSSYPLTLRVAEKSEGYPPGEQSRSRGSPGLRGRRADDEGFSIGGFRSSRRSGTYLSHVAERDLCRTPRFRMSPAQHSAAVMKLCVVLRRR